MYYCLFIVCNIPWFMEVKNNYYWGEGCICKRPKIDKLPSCYAVFLFVVLWRFFEKALLSRDVFGTRSASILCSSFRNTFWKSCSTVPSEGVPWNAMFWKTSLIDLWFIRLYYIIYLSHEISLLKEFRTKFPS